MSGKMDKAKTVLNLIILFDKADRETIMGNINYMMPKLADRRMKQYQKIFEITGKSRSFVLTWFNGNVKLPLIDLCKIANLFEVNVYSLMKNNGSCDVLLKESALDDILFGKDIASIYIEVFEAHKAADKDVVVDALEKYYGFSTEYKSNRMERVCEITGATKVAYHSWFSRARKRVRLPLDGLCKLAIAADVDIMDFLQPKPQDPEPNPISNTIANKKPLVDMSQTDIQISSRAEYSALSNRTGECRRSKTKDYINSYLSTKPEKTRIKIQKMIDRDEVYQYEEKLGKSIFEMDTDEIIRMLQTFNRRSRGKTKISYNTIVAIISLYRGFFDWYIYNVEVIRNPFNSKKLRGRSIEHIYTEEKKEKISQKKIEDAIKALRKRENEEYADYCEMLIRMYFEGFANTLDIVSLKEEDMDHERKTVTIRGKEHPLSDCLYELLVKIHNMEYFPAYRGEYTLVQHDGSYLKFPTRESFTDVERDSVYWQQYLSRLFKNKIAPCFDIRVNYRNIYLCGLYEKIAEKYGKERTDEMIVSIGDRESNTILEKEADDYGAVGEIKNSLRVCMIPD